MRHVVVEWLSRCTSLRSLNPMLTGGMGGVQPIGQHLALMQAAVKAFYGGRLHTSPRINSSCKSQGFSYAAHGFLEHQ